MKVICDNCGEEIEVALPMGFMNRKGQGAKYGSKIKKLGKMRMMVLDVIAELGAVSQTLSVPKRKIQAVIFKRGVKISGNALSGRLSELCGMGHIKMIRRTVKLHHPEDEFKFRFKKTPCWYLVEKDEKN